MLNLIKFLMNKKHYTAILIFLILSSFYTVPVFASGEFKVKKGQFSRNSFRIASRKKEFSRNSFSLRKGQEQFSRNSFTIANKGEFSRNSFTIANRKRVFSRNSFVINSK